MSTHARNICEQALTRLNLSLAAYLLACDHLRSLTNSTRWPYTVDFGAGMQVSLNDSGHVERLQIELGWAFLPRVKAILEWTTKELLKPTSPKPKQKKKKKRNGVKAHLSALESGLGLAPGSIQFALDDMSRLEKLYALRNVFVHNDAVVDKEAIQRGVASKEDEDLWVEPEHMWNWFALVGRVVDAVRRALP